MLKNIQQPNLAKILKPFSEKWVALSPNKKKVVSSGDTLKETESKVNPNKLQEVVFMRVPSFSKLFVPPVL